MYTYKRVTEFSKRLAGWEPIATGFAIIDQDGEMVDWPLCTSKEEAKEIIRLFVKMNRVNGTSSKEEAI